MWDYSYQVIGLFDCQVIPSTATDNYSLVEALVARILFELIIWFNQFGLVLCFSYNKSLMPAFFNNLFGKDMSDIDEKQLLLYAQMANLVNLILQWPEISIKEIAENFSKVSSQIYWCVYIIKCSQA